MKRMFAITLVALVFLVSANQAQATSTNGLNFSAMLEQAAQASSVITPDDRYKGYPRELIEWPTAPPNKDSCKAQEFYEPDDTHLEKYMSRVKVAPKPRVQQHDECVWMLTRNKWRYVMRPAGTKVAVDLNGRDLFDLGSGKGKVCVNPRPFSVAYVAAEPVNTSANRVSVEPFDFKLTEPAAPAVTTTPVATPPPARATTTPVATITTTREHRADSGLVLTFGVEYIFGHVGQEYTDPIPDRGDVPQRHSFAAIVPVIKVEESRNSGWFVSAAISALGTTSAKEFQDVTGAWNVKKRDSDKTRDKVTKVVGGYKLPISDNVSVAPYVGYSRWCVCESYTGQGATTTTQLSFSGVVLGGELAGNVGDRATVTVNGEFGPSLKRESWTHQTYPGITFPRVDHPDEKGKSFGFRAAVEARIAGPLHATAAFDYLGVSSVRPENFAAKEKTSRNSISIGVAYKWGK